MQDSDVPPAFESFRSRVFSASHELVERVTAPVAFWRRDELTLDRSCVFLAVGDHHFAITAEHHLREIAKEGYHPAIVPPRPDGSPVVVPIEKMYMSSDKQLDIAIFRLDTGVVQALGTDYRFLRLDQIRLAEPSPREGPFFLVTGFPQVNLSRDANDRRRADVHRYLTVLHEDPGNIIENFDAASHIALKYSRDSRHTSGTSGPPPKAPGMSGCGIWYLPIPFGPDAWTAQDMKLVGVQTSWHRSHGYLKGTVIGCALFIIWSWFSDTRDPMRVHGLSF